MNRTLIALAIALASSQAAIATPNVLLCREGTDFFDSRRSYRIDLGAKLMHEENPHAFDFGFDVDDDLPIEVQFDATGNMATVKTSKPSIQISVDLNPVKVELQVDQRVPHLYMIMNNVKPDMEFVYKGNLTRSTLMGLIDLESDLVCIKAKDTTEAK